MVTDMQMKEPRKRKNNKKKSNQFYDLAVVDS